MNKALVGVVILVMFTLGCTSKVALINPQTGQTVECGANFMALGDPFTLGVATGIAKRSKECVYHYENLGYVRADRFRESGQLLGVERQRKLREQIQQVRDECRAKRLSGELPGYETSARCSNDRIRFFYADSGFPYMDLVDLLLAYQIAVSKRIDIGEISEEEANVQLAEVETRIVSEEQRRSAVTAQASSQARQAQAAQEQARAAQHQALQNSLDRLNAWSRETRLRQPVTCVQTMTAMGSVITCN